MSIRSLSVARKYSTVSRGTLHKLAEWYRNFWSPKPHCPPYTHICQIGDPALRLRASEVRIEEIPSTSIKDVLLRMRNTMLRYQAVGISAPQIGVPLRIIMIHFPDSLLQGFGSQVCEKREMSHIPFQAGRPMFCMFDHLWGYSAQWITDWHALHVQVFINPTMEITDFKKISFPEACESVKGFSALVPRYRGIRLKGYDFDGSPLNWESTGWGARIAQHEMDHLEGKMFTDIMDCLSLQNDGWKAINAKAGDVKLYYKHR